MTLVQLQQLRLNREVRPFQTADDGRVALQVLMACGAPSLQPRRSPQGSWGLACTPERPGRSTLEEAPLLRELLGKKDGLLGVHEVFPQESL